MRYGKMLFLLFFPLPVASNYCLAQEVQDSDEVESFVITSPNSSLGINGVQLDTTSPLPDITILAPIRAPNEISRRGFDAPQAAALRILANYSDSINEMLFGTDRLLFSNWVEEALDIQLDLQDVQDYCAWASRNNSLVNVNEMSNRLTNLDLMSNQRIEDSYRLLLDNLSDFASDLLETRANEIHREVVSTTTNWNTLSQNNPEELISNQERICSRLTLFLNN